MSKILYICSAGHSGSTLLDLMIGSHPNVTSLGEISQLPKNLSLNTECTCGKKVRECALWSKVISNLESKLDISIKKYPYSLNLGFFSAKVVVDHAHQNIVQKFKKKIVLGLWYVSLRFGLPVPSFFISAVHKGAENSFLLYDQVSDIMDTEFVVDSSKNYLKALSLYKQRPDLVKIVLLARDGRGVFFSGIKRGFSKGESIGSWKKYYTRAIPLLNKHVKDEDIIRVSYESLAASPGEELNRIYKFIGISKEDVSTGLSDKTIHITNGNNMRFKKLDIKLDTSWQTNLQDSDMNYFNTVAGSLNKELGYSSNL